MLVADTGHQRVVRLSQSGAELGAWRASGGPTGQLQTPYGLTLGADRTILVADPEAQRIEAYAPDGTPTGGWSTGEWHSLGLFTEPSGSIWSAERMVIGGVKTTFYGRLRQYRLNGDSSPPSST
jgi:hypothetical protein